MILRNSNKQIHFPQTLVKTVPSKDYFVTEVNSISTDFRATRPDLEVFVCTLESFPNGTAHTNKVGLFARAMQSAGIPVSILMLDAWEDQRKARNSDVRGLFHGIPFEYTPGRTTAASNFLLRNILKVRGIIVALQRLRKSRHKHKVAMFYVHDGGRLLALLIACKILRIRTIVDLCEWMPAFADASFFNRWGYSSGTIFRMCDAIIPISHLLEKCVTRIAGEDAPPLFHLSNLIDPVEFEGVVPKTPRPCYILWAGLMDQYRDTVRFLLSAFQQIQKSHPEVLLILCGGASEQTKAEIMQRAERELLPGTLVMPGFVSRNELLEYYAGALALLIPLENNEQSQARFPFKLGEYLLTGRPVVSSHVGDIPNYLEHGHSAMLAIPDDPDSFAACVNTLLSDPNYATKLGESGRQVGYNAFDYRKVGPAIAAFVEEISK